MDRQPSRFDWAHASYLRCLHILFWWWLNPILSLGYKRELTDNDLDDLSSDDKCSVLLNQFSHYCDKNTQCNYTKTWRLVMGTFWKEFVFVIFLLLPYHAVRIAQPILLREIVLYISHHQESPTTSIQSYYGYFYAVGLFGCSASQAFLHQQAYFRAARMGMRVRNALSAAIYKRLLSLNTASLQKTTAAQIVNLIANDANKFEEFGQYMHYLWEAPLQALIAFGFIFWFIGIFPTLFGYAVLILLIPLQLAFSRQFSQYRRTTMTCGDKRMQAMNELINGCHIIKMYNWEKPMEERVKAMRRDELASIVRASRLRAINMGLYFSSLPLIALATFGGSWLLGNKLEAVEIFTALTLFGMIRVPVTNVLPMAIEKFAEVLAASKRIDAFWRIEKVQERIKPNEQESMLAVTMQNASFSWTDTTCLFDINMQIESGTLVGIVGPIGAGKSSLLAAILGEMSLISGTLDVYGSYSYASQSPWIFADTIRANILLGKPLNEQRYQSVLHACCLDIDLDTFGEARDLTMIAEKGVNLSGGQKARIALARAVYIEADIYLFDDPLAAVDKQVARRIYHQCIGPHGLLKHKTRILVTHQTHFLGNSAHPTIFLRNGHIETGRHLEAVNDIHSQLINGDDTEKATTTSALLVDFSQTTVDKKSIVVAESLTAGGVNLSIWYRLFSSTFFGWFGFFLLIIIMLLGEGIYDVSNRWLSLWSAKSYNEQRSPLQAYIYLGLTLGTLILALLRAQYYFYLILCGANSLHNRMLTGLLRTSLRFFESNPSGRILNRASKDQQVVDELLPIILFDALQCLLMTLGSLVIIGIVNLWVLSLLIILLPTLLYLRYFYLRSSRQIKRLESVTRSPMYGLFSSSLNGGLPTIRAFNVQDDFVQLFIERVDANSRALFILIAAVRWFGLRLDLMTSLLSLLTAVLTVALRDSIDSSSAALSLMYCINLTMLFQWAVRQSAEAENCMTSAERIHEYSQLPSEEDETSVDQFLQPPSDWPSEGKIEFRKYSMRYRSELDSVLQNIDLCIKPQEKIGIIGRTGAGKSSLFQALFRLIDYNSVGGQILIDGIDISRIALSQLRSRLSVIPQQPILFAGTLRYNLDPFEQFPDEQCFLALELVQLKHLVSDHPDGLYQLVTESGSNFSIGQCQLICVARALLKKSKILMIDEATANVDQTTDGLIQTVIADKFRDRTILTIAHRLHTVVASDRILVLHRGMVVDFDVPTEILPKHGLIQRFNNEANGVDELVHF